MRIAVLSDTHGNPLALEAVLADVAATGGADAYWLVGDYAALGYDPVGTVERLAALPNATYVRGNTDRHVLTFEHPAPDVAAIRADPDRVPFVVELARSFAWTQGAVGQAGLIPWFEKLPLERRETLPDGTRVLLVHASPGTDDGPGVRPTTTDEQLAALVGDPGADLVIVGHTHWPSDRRVGATRVVNLGSASNPYPPDLRASYAIIEAEQKGHRLEHRRVDYDREAVIAGLRRARHPAAGYIVDYMRGQLKPIWAPA